MPNGDKERPMRKTLLAVLATAIALASLAGCMNFAAPPTKLVNEQTIAMSGIEKIEIEYLSADVEIRLGSTDELVLREYMSDDDESLFAKTKQSGDTLAIEAGKRPTMAAFSAYVEIELPQGYAAALQVTTLSGDIKLPKLLTATALEASSTSGDIITAGEIKAQTIGLNTTSGNIDCVELSGSTIELNTVSGDIACGDLKGNVTANTTSGDIDLLGIDGSVEAASTSGEMDISVQALKGDVTLGSSSGDITATLPGDASFTLRMENTSGDIRTRFAENKEDAHHLSATVGSDPVAMVRVTATSGDIRVN